MRAPYCLRVASMRFMAIFAGSKIFHCPPEADQWTPKLGTTQEFPRTGIHLYHIPGVSKEGYFYHHSCLKGGGLEDVCNRIPLHPGVRLRHLQRNRSEEHTSEL